jgi:hypothetical protein
VWFYRGWQSASRILDRLKREANWGLENSHIGQHSGRCNAKAALQIITQLIGEFGAASSQSSGRENK